MLFRTVAVRQRFSTFSGDWPLRRGAVGIIFWAHCGTTRRDGNRVVRT
jgi:hypothetical protein